MSGRAKIITSGADDLPLNDESVDLIVTSPPFWMLRDYRDGGEHMEGQIGQEPAWEDYIESLVRCTREWCRVLKPTGSLWVNLGDKYGRGTRTTIHGGHSKQAYVDAAGPGVCAPTGYEKSLIGLPWRYALRCADELGLKLRAEVVWSKPNGLPESVTDRVRRSHEQFFHFTKRESYYGAVDDIRIPYEADDSDGNPLGRVPGSVWEVPTEPLAIPDYVRGMLGEELDHYAAFPTALIRPIVKGFSPRTVCTACGQGRFPVASVSFEAGWTRHTDSTRTADGTANPGEGAGQQVKNRRLTTIAGYACACTPFTDHPGRRGIGWHEDPSRRDSGGAVPVDGGQVRANGVREPQGPVREYHLDRWDPPPGKPGVVLDPFGGTGTAALVAVAHGRAGISSDLSGDYAVIANWRTGDGAERAKALGVKRTPKKHRLNEHLYGDLYGDVDELIG